MHLLSSLALTHTDAPQRWAGVCVRWPVWCRRGRWNAPELSAVNRLSHTAERCERARSEWTSDSPGSRLLPAHTHTHTHSERHTHHTEKNTHTHINSTGKSLVMMFSDGPSKKQKDKMILWWVILYNYAVKAAWASVCLIGSPEGRVWGSSPGGVSAEAPPPACCSSERPIGMKYTAALDSPP